MNYALGINIFLLIKIFSRGWQWGIVSAFVIISLSSQVIAKPISTEKIDAKAPSKVLKDSNNQKLNTQLTLNKIAPFNPENNLSQSEITPVSQLSDVRPNDWAFTALQSLVARYGCISGYPDSKFLGQRTISRHEFAAGLNGCLDKINEIVAAGLASKVSKDDVNTIQKLQEEFATELSILRGRIVSLEEKISKLETQQFSPTTKLFGQAVFGLQGRLPNSADFKTRPQLNNGKPDLSTNLTFGYNISLSLFTQFDSASRNLLVVGLNSANLNLGNNSEQILQRGYTLLGYEGDTNNQIKISDLSYRFKASDNLSFIVGAAGVSPISVFRGANRIENSGTGSISAFAQRNPILGLGGGSAGIGFDWQISDRVSLQGVYAANDPANPVNGGLIGGSYVTGLQATLSPTNSVDVALYYLHSFSNNGNLNTGIGDYVITFPFFDPTIFLTDAIGATINWRISPYVTLGAWGGYTNSNAVNIRDSNRKFFNDNSGTVETNNWMVYLNFPDLFKQGNLAGIYIGQPPKITSSNLISRNGYDANIPGALGFPNTSGAAIGGQPDTTTHLELFYVHRLTDNISITPGLIFVFHPIQTAGSDTITIGTIRTTFRF
ncbi:iron uptake porin [Pseudanabaena yagii]|uniref:Iron uptake porin n=1 Tax=Pseudanabaena yagii GIHE-NHR1 TaxID=2722753 RepID=A0ABX1LQR3_9CYAN|nr:iron uptake porin [Pseudanabaena yagii]NMF57435.1 iron uptake porin [Pseudanabaena yagii GIHE-NHR1]